MNKEYILQKVPLFARLNPEHLGEMARRSRLLSFRRGEVIIQEDSRDNRLFIVIRGKVKVVKGLGMKHERHLQTFEGYVHFGEMSLIDDLNRSASVVAETDTQVLSIDQSDFRTLIRENADVAFDLLKTLSRRLRSMNKSISETLGNLAPVCVVCHKIFDKNIGWVNMEKYVSDHSEIESNRSICPNCSKQNFQKFYR